MLSYQRRVHTVKEKFLCRYKRTPLGVNVAYWDRTEEQTRKALHGHILTWNKRRKLAEGYKPRPVLEELHARQWQPKVGKAVHMNAEEAAHFRTETVRVHAELVRFSMQGDIKHPRETLH